jgi:hypothetical protein
MDYESKLHKIYEDLKCPAECSGAVFAYGGRIVGMDLFDQNSTFRKLWPKLIRSYAIDAMEEAGESPALTPQSIRAWFKSASEAKSEKFRSPGLGDDVRLQTDDLVGSSLVLNDQPIHTEIFDASK